MMDTFTEKNQGTKRCSGSGCRPMDSAERKEYGGAPISRKMPKNSSVDADYAGSGLLEQIVSPGNLNDAYRCVRRSGGAGGVSQETDDDILGFLRTFGGKLRQAVLDRKYRPNPNGARILIPDESRRILDVPANADVVVQRAVAQVLNPIFRAQFARTSYSADSDCGPHSAVRQCLSYLNARRVWTVRLDIEEIRSAACQSKLVQVLSQTIEEGRVVSLVHRYLREGAVRLADYDAAWMGGSHGSPIGHLCTDVLLNELDHELERRGHFFVRLGCTSVIFCRSRASADQALAHIIPYIEKKLFLNVNLEKSEACFASKVEFLGYGFYRNPSRVWKPCVHRTAKAALWTRIRQLTSRRRIVCMDSWMRALRVCVVGWVNHFRLANMATWLRQTDEWMQRRIRMVFWKRWKKVGTRYRNLRKLGISHAEAVSLSSSRRGFWHNARQHALNTALSEKRLTAAGFQFFYPYYSKVRA